MRFTNLFPFMIGYLHICNRLSYVLYSYVSYQFEIEWIRLCRDSRRSCHESIYTEMRVRESKNFSEKKNRLSKSTHNRVSTELESISQKVNILRQFHSHLFAFREKRVPIHPLMNVFLILVPFSLSVSPHSFSLSLFRSTRLSSERNGNS